MEIPRRCSISIQSDVTPLRPALPCTAPAESIAEACRASASVRVDLPASGWLITANVRRRAASVTTRLTHTLLAGGRAPKSRSVHALDELDRQLAVGVVGAEADLVRR